MNSTFPLLHQHKTETVVENQLFVGVDLSLDIAWIPSKQTFFLNYTAGTHCYKSPAESILKSSMTECICISMIL